MPIKMDNPRSPLPALTWRQLANHLDRTATRPKRSRLIACLLLVLIAVVGASTSCHSKAAGGELMLTGATDPGANAFMPRAAPPPPTNTQPPPTLQPQGDGTTVATQPLPGDRDGLYGGTVDHAGVDRDKMITFLGAHPAQASAFVDALNTDSTLFWSGGRPLAVADIATYLRELTPVMLRLDTRVTNHGFDGTHLRTLQSVLQAGTAVLVDAHGIPRVRALSGNPLTALVVLRGAPTLVGTPWPGYRPGALVEVVATTAAITTFVLIDVVTDQPFNRPVGTNGTNDTPHTQPVTSPGPASTTTTTTQKPGLDIDGTYLWHRFSFICSGHDYTGLQHDMTVIITHQGSTLTIAFPGGPDTGSLNADGSFSVSFSNGGTVRGVFATEDGRTDIRDGVEENNSGCNGTFTATKQ